MTAEIPVACFLTDKELQQRRTDHLNKIAALLVDFKELENGFSYRFPIEGRFNFSRLFSKCYDKCGQKFPTATHLTYREF
jgi:hypothetical protein